MVALREKKFNNYCQIVNFEGISLCLKITFPLIKLIQMVDWVIHEKLDRTKEMIELNYNNIKK